MLSKVIFCDWNYHNIEQCLICINFQCLKVVLSHNVSAVWDKAESNRKVTGMLSGRTLFNVSLVVGRGAFGGCGV